MTGWMCIKAEWHYVTEDKYTGVCPIHGKH